MENHPSQNRKQNSFIFLFTFSSLPSAEDHWNLTNCTFPFTTKTVVLINKIVILNAAEILKQ